MTFRLRLPHPDGPAGLQAHSKPASWMTYITRIPSLTSPPKKDIEAENKVERIACQASGKTKMN